MKKKDTSIFASYQEMRVPEELRACFNAYGLYHCKQFVLRLSPINHENLYTLEGRSKARLGSIDQQTLQSYGTYVHENIHWWQHKGSTCGFIRSMLQISFIHNNFERLTELHSKVGGSKTYIKMVDSKAIFRGL